MELHSPYYRVRLKDELIYRIQKNSSYSLRSFAKALDLSSGALSQILSGKRRVSTKLVARILGVLELSPVEREKFLSSVLAEKSSLKRISPALRQQLANSNLSQTTFIDRAIGLDEFRIVSDWYHTAILELTYSKDFKSDLKWIARALGITQIEAKLAVERLFALDLLTDNGGRWIKSDFNLQTKDHTKTSDALRKRQKQILEKSIFSLENDSITDRSHSGLTVCIATKNIPEAKLRIQKFLWQLGKDLVQGEVDRVYEINVSLFPLQTKATK